MILTEFAAETDPVALSRSDLFKAALEDSARWDLRSPYVRREIAVNHVVRNKDDAVSTLAARRADT